MTLYRLRESELDQGGLDLPELRQADMVWALRDARTHVTLLVQDLDVRVINAITGELLRELTIGTSKDFQPRK